MKLIYTTLCICILVSCHTPTPPEEAPAYRLEGDTIIVDAESVITAKIQTVKVEETAFQTTLTTTGTVRAIPNFYAEIAPPFSGRVTRVFLKLGMKTRPGTALFEMASPEFTEIQKSFFQAKSEYNAAQANLKRQQDLFAHGVAAKRDLEEAQTFYDIQKQEYENAAAGLRIYGINTRSFTLGQPLVITSPIEGEVIANDIVLGHYIRADEEPRAKIARLDKVWVAGEVKEKDIEFLNRLQSAEVYLNGPERKYTASVYHIDEMVDEDTRSLKVLLEIQNEDHSLKPGMYVNASFKDTAQNTILIPLKAVLQYNDQSFVFVQTSTGKYLRRFIKTGNSVDDQIVVTEGLAAGETIISEGAFYLLEAK